MVRARKAAAGLKQIADRPQCVLSSPLVRARQTATILAEFASWPKALECAALAPDEPPEEIFSILANHKEKVIAVVGHQPGLGRLLAACLPAQVRGGVNPEAFELKKMGAALISFPRPLAREQARYSGCCHQESYASRNKLVSNRVAEAPKRRPARVAMLPARRAPCSMRPGRRLRAAIPTTAGLLRSREPDQHDQCQKQYSRHIENIVRR